MDFEMPDAINAFGDSFLTMMAAVVVVCGATGLSLLPLVAPLGMSRVLALADRGGGRGRELSDRI